MVTIVVDFPSGSMVKNLPAKEESQVWSLGQEDPLEKEMATRSSSLAWEIPWIEKPGGLWTIVSHSQIWLKQLSTHYYMLNMLPTFYFYCFKDFFLFLMWTIFKVFIEFVTILFIFFFFMFWFFGWKACGILAPWPGIKPVPSALEGGLNHWTTREVPASLIMKRKTWWKSCIFSLVISLY